MKTIILIISLIFISCKTCPECKPIYVPTIVAPVIACQTPVSLTELKSKNKKDMTAADIYVNTSGEIVITESFNKKSAEYVNAIEQAVSAWESYEVCVETVIENYEKMKDTIEKTK